MVEDNVNNREVTTMELAKALKMQLEAIKHQGAREALAEQNFSTDVDKRSNEVIAERNGMSVKQVQRHIALTRLIPPLQDMVDGKVIGADRKTVENCVYSCCGAFLYKAQKIRSILPLP